jgi:hypothetical protein
VLHWELFPPRNCSLIHLGDPSPKFELTNLRKKKKRQESVADLTKREPEGLCLPGFQVFATMSADLGLTAGQPPLQRTLTLGDQIESTFLTRPLTQS